MENFKKDLNTDRAVEIANIILKGFQSVAEEMPEGTTMAEFGVATILFLNEIENEMLGEFMPFRISVSLTMRALEEAIEIYGEKVEEELGNEGGSEGPNEQANRDGSK